MLSVTVLCIVMLSVFMLNVVMLSVVVPKHSSLFILRVSDEEKSFYNFDTWTTMTEWPMESFVEFFWWNLLIFFIFKNVFIIYFYFSQNKSFWTWT